MTRSAWRVDLDRDRRRAREIAKRGSEAVIEPRRSYARRDLAEIADRRADLVHDLVERGREDLRLRGKRELESTELDAERYQPLLRSVVEVAFQASALLVACFDDARARCLDFGELDSHLDPEPSHLDRERCGREDAVEQITALEQGRIVEQHRRAHVVAPDLAGEL